MSIRRLAVALGLFGGTTTSSYEKAGGKSASYKKKLGGHVPLVPPVVAPLRWMVILCEKVEYAVRTYVGVPGFYVKGRLDIGRVDVLLIILLDLFSDTCNAMHKVIT